MLSSSHFVGLLVWWLLQYYLSPVAALPVGFIDEGVVSRDAIITGTFAPNPRKNNTPMLLLSSKNGQIYAVEDPDNSEDNVPIGDFESLICSNGERGLQSVVPHPRFAETLFIYLFFTSFVDGCPEDFVTGPPNHVSRFTMNPETLWIDVESEVIILATSPSPKKVHNGGSMLFGVDGYLYITTGDSGQRDPSYSQDLTNLFGSLLRVDENGDAPDENPYTTASGGTGVACGKNFGKPPSGSADDAVCEEIFAYGLRNPFRLTMNYSSVDRVLFSIGDVGASHWEELSVGGTDYAGANYGWPIHEGPCKIGKYDDCPIPDPSITEPYYFYQHTALRDGGCVTGSVFVPEGIWPEKYKFLYIDFVFNTTYNIVEDPSRECRECTPPVPAYYNETFYERDRMIDMFFGPYQDTQALYVISRNSGQSIRRIRYTGSNNAAPVANFTVSDDAVDTNELIVFDGSASSDGDNDVLTYLWDFGDEVTSTETAPQHSYANSGQYIVKLTVTDALGQTNQVQLTIVVGMPPVADLVLPVVDSRFSVGQLIRVFGNGTDSRGNSLNDTQISWEVRQHHSDHFHPFLDKFVGNNFTLDPAPPPEDFSAATNSYLEIIMYATDSFGIVTTITRNVLPKKVFIEIVSNPPGMEVLIDEFPVTTPINISSWENHKLKLNVVDQGDNTFQSWSIGGDRKTNYTVPARQLTNPSIVVTFSGGVPSPVVSTPVASSPAASAPNLIEQPVVAPVLSAPVQPSSPAPSVPTGSLEIPKSNAFAARQNDFYLGNWFIASAMIMYFHVIPK